MPISGAIIDILGGYSSSITRAMLSLCVPKEELGKIFSFLAFIDGLLPFAVSEIYASIWIVSSLYSDNDNLKLRIKSVLLVINE